MTSHFWRLHSIRIKLLNSQLFYETQMGDLRNGEAFSVFGWVFWLVLVFFFFRWIFSSSFMLCLTCFPVLTAIAFKMIKWFLEMKEKLTLKWPNYFEINHRIYGAVTGQVETVISSFFIIENGCLMLEECFSYKARCCSDLCGRILNAAS